MTAPIRPRLKVIMFTKMRSLVVDLVHLEVAIIILKIDLLVVTIIIWWYHYNLVVTIIILKIDRDRFFGGGNLLGMLKMM